MASFADPSAPLSSAKFPPETDITTIEQKDSVGSKRRYFAARVDLPIERFVAPYAVQFVEEIVAHCRGDYPGHDLILRAPR